MKHHNGMLLLTGLFISSNICYYILGPLYLVCVSSSLYNTTNVNLHLVLILNLGIVFKWMGLSRLRGDMLHCVPNEIIDEKGPFHNRTGSGSKGDPRVHWKGALECYFRGIRLSWGRQNRALHTLHEIQTIGMSHKPMNIWENSATNC